MEDIFAEMSYGKLALKKLAPVAPNFKLYFAGWLGKTNERQVMEVRGAVFRQAKRGVRKGKFCIIVPGTERTAYVTKEEMLAFEEDGK